ncbi:MAG: Transcription initiation factor TFIID subunit 13 [Alectoria fallacina]|uniref:Transcription initiation factor TFIID subunit 13 n=1 Tax=Alectoria fallacina TaxID=1903189 RepID=A0A8H3PKH4_9LECA|nr:MAG: Transcription initiation factor TFIID subunit 13 [Alectoria fallacina]
MTEVRARAARHKGQMNFEAELTQALYAYGDDKEPLPETVRIVDEMATDFIIETCFSAAKSAECCSRSKLKVDDFKFAIRGDPVLLGRVNELLAMDKHINTARKAFKTDEGREGLERGSRKRKGEGKDGEDKVEDKAEDKGVKVEEKVAEELGDDLDDDME